MEYVIDANILINLGIFTPIHFHKQFWKQMEIKVENGSIILLDVVASEVKYGDVGKWVNTMKGSGVVTQINTAVRNRGVAINNQYKMITTAPGGSLKSTADPFTR